MEEFVSQEEGTEEETGQVWAGLPTVPAATGDGRFLTHLMRLGDLGPGAQPL